MGMIDEKSSTFTLFITFSFVTILLLFDDQNTAACCAALLLKSMGSAAKLILMGHLWFLETEMTILRVRLFSRQNQEWVLYRENYNGKICPHHCYK